MSLFSSGEKAIVKVIENWLEDNEDELLENISGTIHEWLEENKEQIFDIIKKEQMNINK